ncbi:MAG: hypothetical protein KAG61_07370 [Bacteriovoracaceae bacterium]|nr:hypothetical protein [Bacteriovoracaceae bacterium]
MSLKNQILLLLGTTTLFTSCANYHRMESVDDKMSRYHSKRDSTNSVPKVAASKTKFSARRGPASYNMKPKTNYTNKQLYFMALYSQYDELGMFSKAKAPGIKSCPGNHTAWLNYKNKFKGKLPSKKLSVMFDKNHSTWGKDYSALYPELSLPVSIDAPTPTVADMIKGSRGTNPEKILGHALDIHLSKTYMELKQLCNYGISDNYYAFENLISEVKREKRFTASTANMQLLLKTTLFTNMSLIKSFEGKKRGRSIASHKDDILTQEVMLRLKAPWAKEYFKKMQGKK